jgi:hypothetical protein
MPERAPARDSGADDYRLLLTVIAGIALGVAATATPALIEGPFGSWLWAAKLLMWLTGVGAVILEYLAVLFGSRLYLRPVEFFATTSLALVFLAQAGMFTTLGLAPDKVGPRWFVLFALYNVFAALEAEHARRVVLRHAGGRYGQEVVRPYAVSLRQVSALVLLTGVLSLLFVLVWRDPPPGAVFVAAALALATVVTANVQQHRIRVRLGPSVDQSVGG